MNVKKILPVIAFTLLALQLVAPIATQAQTIVGSFKIYVNGNLVPSSTGLVTVTPGDAVTITGVSYKGTYPLELKIEGPSGVVYSQSIYPRTDGSFATTFTVPEIPRLAPPSYYVLTIKPVGITDEYIQWEDSGIYEVNVEVKPKISVMPATITNFQQLFLSGVGFGASATVTIYFYAGADESSSIVYTTTVTTNADGSFEKTIGTLKLGISDTDGDGTPDLFLAGGAHLIRAENPDGENATATFNIVPGLLYVYYDPRTGVPSFQRSLTLPKKAVADVTDPYIEIIVAGLEPGEVYSLELTHDQYTDIRIPLAWWAYFEWTGSDNQTYLNATTCKLFRASNNGNIWLRWEPYYYAGGLNGSVSVPDALSTVPATAADLVYNGSVVARTYRGGNTLDLYPLDRSYLNKTLFELNDVKFNYTVPGGTYTLHVYSYYYNDTSGEAEWAGEVATFESSLTYNALIQITDRSVVSGDILFVALFSYVPGITSPINAQIFIDRQLVGVVSLDTTWNVPTGNYSGTFLLEWELSMTIPHGGHEFKVTEEVTPELVLEAIDNFVVGSGYQVNIPEPALPEDPRSVTPPPPEYAQYDPATGAVYSDLYSKTLGCSCTGTGSCDTTVTASPETITSSYYEVVVYGVSPGETISIYLERFYDLYNTTKDLGVSYWWYFNTAHPGATRMLLWQGSIGTDNTVTGTPAISVSYENNVLTVRLATIPLPQGFYTITVESSVQGGLDPVGNTYLSVVPKLYIEPVVVVGPAMLKVEGYGFPAAEALEFIAPILNGSDAIAGVNLHMRMLSTWTIDANGTLTSIGFGNVNIEPGIYLPVLEPGAYIVQLVYRITSTGSYAITAPTTVYVINNVTKIVSSDYIDQKFQAIDEHLADVESTLAAGLLDIAIALGNIDEKISNINVSVDLGPVMNELSDIRTTIGAMQLDVETIRNKMETVPANILSAIYSVDSKVDSLSGYVGSLYDIVGGVGDKVDALSSSISTLSNDVSQVKSLVADVPNIASKVNSIEGAVTQIVQGLDNLPASVADSLAGLLNQIKSSADAAKASADAAKNEIDAKAVELSSSIDALKTDLGSKVDTTQTAVYLAVIFALLAFIGSIVTLLMVRKASAA